MKNVLIWITLAWAIAWSIVVSIEPSLWPIAALGFVQNIAFTFVSRGRNSGSLGYHLLASIFSNGIYAALLFVSIDMIAQAKSNPAPFLVVYALSTMAGSIFAHWLALRLERGKQRNVQKDMLDTVQAELNETKLLLSRSAAACEDIAERLLFAEHQLAQLGRVDILQGVMDVSPPHRLSAEQAKAMSQQGRVGSSS